MLSDLLAKENEHFSDEKIIIKCLVELRAFRFLPKAYCDMAFESRNGGAGADVHC
jgi:hypothetical protein